MSSATGPPSRDLQSPATLLFADQGEQQGSGLNRRPLSECPAQRIAALGAESVSTILATVTAVVAAI